MVIDYSLLSPKERLSFERISAFYGASMAEEFFVEYLKAPMGERNLTRASGQVLARKETQENVDSVAFLKQRFCSGPSVDEIVFD